MRRWLQLVTVGLVAVAGIALAASPLAATADVHCDFNGDERADFAAGAPGEDFAGKADAGRVYVVYASADGDIGPREQDAWPAVDRPGPVPLEGAQLGAALACGDFDGDGFADLAVGAPGQQVGDHRAGAVSVLYGARGGLGTRHDVWHAARRGVKSAAEEGDQLGRSVATGDFDRDGFDDLVVGIPGKDVADAADDEDAGADVTDAGALLVLYGSADGVSARDDYWHQDQPGAAPVAGARDFFATDVTGGDFDGDGFDDLAVGVPGETIANRRAGAVHVFYGSPRGVSARDELWHQDAQGIRGGAEAADAFGNVVVAADLDADGAEDLIVGVPGEGIGRSRDAGAVQVLHGSRGGVSTRDVMWHQDGFGVAGVAETDDEFGAAVTTGDFDGDGLLDLAVGVPGDTNGEDGPRAGAVHVLYGSQERTAARNALWHQDDSGIAGGAEPGDGFGAALFAGDLSADGTADLVIGAPREALDGAERAGGVHVVFPGAETLVRPGRMLHQASDGMAGEIEAGDRLGWSLPNG